MRELTLRTALWSVYLGCRGGARTLRTVQTLLPDRAGAPRLRLPAPANVDGRP